MLCEKPKRREISSMESRYQYRRRKTRRSVSESEDKNASRSDKSSFRHRNFAGHTPAQLVQGQRKLPAASFFRAIVPQAVDREPPRDLAQKRGKPVRLAGRHGVPRAVVSIVDALLRVLRAF